MILWLSGPFGAGKTTVAAALAAADPTVVVLDTELVGTLLDQALRARLPVRDFQEWRSWRAVVVAALVAVHREVGGVVVVPQTVVDRDVWSELRAGLEAAGIAVRTVVLDVDATEHGRRIAGDLIESGAAAWRRERRPDFDAARSWLEREGEVVDTTSRTPEEVVDAVRMLLARADERA